MLYFLQQVLNGLHSGALYALLAFGYVLTNGVLHRTNLAYGALFAFCRADDDPGRRLRLAGAVADAAGDASPSASSWPSSTPRLIGHVLSRNVFVPLADRSPNAIVVATLGVSLVLMELAASPPIPAISGCRRCLAQPIVFAAGRAASR